MNNEIGLDLRKLFYSSLQSMSAAEKIEALKKFYENLPKQGSSEWLSSRKIGASAAAGVLGVSKYSSPKQVALELLGLGDFEHRIETKWGTIFEDAVKKWLEHYIEIHEFGSIPGFGFPTVYTSCSPDGVFIMTPEFAQIHKNNVNEMVGRVMLLEIKCPYARYIKPEVPEYYIPQLKVGMRTIDCCEGSSFCEFAIRVCSLLDFNFGTSCRVDMQRGINKRPVAIGLIAVYGESAAVEAPCSIEKMEEVPMPAGETLLDQFHNLWMWLDYNAPSTLDMERWEIYRNLFGPEKYWDICKYFGKIVPEWDYVDFGSVNNFNYKWINRLGPELVKLQDFRYLDPIRAEKNVTDWTCKEALMKQLGEISKEGLLGVIPYKIMEAQVQYVPKVDFMDEIKKLCIFGKNIEIIKKKPMEQWPQLIDQFCELFNNTVMSVKPTDK
jgi:hypothetical protein